MDLSSGTSILPKLVAHPEEMETVRYAIVAPRPDPANFLAIESACTHSTGYIVKLAAGLTEQYQHFGDPESLAKHRRLQQESETRFQLLQQHLGSCKRAVEAACAQAACAQPQASEEGRSALFPASDSRLAGRAPETPGVENSTVALSGSTILARDAVISRESSYVQGQASSTPEIVQLPQQSAVPSIAESAQEQQEQHGHDLEGSGSRGIRYYVDNEGGFHFSLYDPGTPDCATPALLIGELAQGSWHVLDWDRTAPGRKMHVILATRRNVDRLRLAYTNLWTRENQLVSNLASSKHLPLGERYREFWEDDQLTGCTSSQEPSDERLDLGVIIPGTVDVFSSRGRILFRQQTREDQEGTRSSIHNAKIEVGDYRTNDIVLQINEDSLRTLYRLIVAMTKVLDAAEAGAASAITTVVTISVAFGVAIVTGIPIVADAAAPVGIPTSLLIAYSYSLGTRTVLSTSS
ncbi:hypothetical protein GGS23DRAFT_601700 [Durotheca rogersii]|uniref:uncharacterized protein n=1 Tax=Durotheca rogersii TaxID=419775 RepID=UPI00221F8AE2|nr:uncharacterized protein GGS23DRAFT_601700 [Durotheca rogersii]KAI5853673.1 hypothetical protein GGS23DRAFT_601700 [Durotheca rogersii]